MGFGQLIRLFNHRYGLCVAIIGHCLLSWRQKAVEQRWISAGPTLMRWPGTDPPLCQHLLSIRWRDILWTPQPGAAPPSLRSRSPRLPGPPAPQCLSMSSQSHPPSALHTPSRSRPPSPYSLTHPHPPFPSSPTNQLFRQFTWWSHRLVDKSPQALHLFMIYSWFKA